MSETAKRTKAAGYVRVSTTEQAREGWSLGDQRRRIKAYCESRGWRLARMYADEGVSSGAHRPEFERMVSEVLADGIDVIVAMKLDRLGRSAAGLLALYEQLESKGVHIVTVEDSVDTGTPQGRLLRTILAAVAEWERDVIRQRTKNGVAAARAGGKRIGAPPFGWGIEDGVLTPISPEQDVLALIRSHRAAGRSLAWIAQTLNDSSMPSRRSRWYPNSVRRALGEGSRGPVA